MTTKQLTAAQLQVVDPKRFEKEYWKWVGYAYWEPCFEFPIERWEKEHGLHVDAEDISYSGFYSQGDGLAFDGRFELARVMDALDLQHKAPALYLDLLNYGTNWVRVNRTIRHSNFMSDSADIDYAPGNCYPAGVFSGLPQEDWDALVEAQWDEWYPTIEEHVVSLARDLANELYSDLRDDYEACTSEEAFIESCECNEITFEIDTDEETCVCI